MNGHEYTHVNNKKVYFTCHHVSSTKNGKHGYVSCKKRVFKLGEKGRLNKSGGLYLLKEDTEWVAWLLASWIDAYEVQFGEQVVARSWYIDCLMKKSSSS